MDELWWLIYLMILSDGYNGPCSETIKHFREKYEEDEYEEDERKRILTDEIKHMCPMKERVHDMNAIIDICCDTGEPCDMHCVGR